MQNDLDGTIDVQILGVNKIGYEYANDAMTSGRDIPWLQDVDSDDNGSSDVWTSWDVRWRDVVILDAENAKVGTFNLAVHDLQVSDDYNALRQMLVDAAVPEPGSLTLLAIAAAGLLAYVWRRGKGKRGHP